MRNSEFIALLTANAHRTARIRVYSGPWYTGASRVPETIITQVGRIVAFIQAKIDQGLLCKADEMLLIYNFQPLEFTNKGFYCSLDMLIKPMAEIEKTQVNIGKQFSLMINGSTTEVISSSKALLELGVITEEELKNDGLEAPISYGYYQDYPTVAFYIALVSEAPMGDLRAILRGDYDHSDMLQHAKAFDSLVEAREYLAKIKGVGKYIGEIAGSKEIVTTLKAKGLGKNIAKIIDCLTLNVVVTPIPETLSKEAIVEDELKRLNEIFHDNKEEFLTVQSNWLEEFQITPKQLSELLQKVREKQALVKETLMQKQTEYEKIHQTMMKYQTEIKQLENVLIRNKQHVEWLKELLESKLNKETVSESQSTSMETSLSKLHM